MARYYAFDLRDFESSASPDIRYLAALIIGLPGGSRVKTAIDEDSAWTLTDVLLANLTNTVNAVAYGMAGKKAGKPPLIGPSWLTGKAAKSSDPDCVIKKDDSQVMAIEELKKRLDETRRAEPQSEEELAELHKALLHNSGGDMVPNG